MNQNYQNPTTDRELGWDDAIQNDPNAFVLLPEGDYAFEVTKFERGRHPGSAKLPPCNKAILTLQITSQNGESTSLQHNLFLHTKTEGMISAFLIAIGQKKEGEPAVPRWNQMVGAKGMCKVGIRSWTGNDGEVRESNEIKKFYKPEERTLPQAAAPTAAQNYKQASPQPVQQTFQTGGGVFTPGQF